MVFTFPFMYSWECFLQRIFSSVSLDTMKSGSNRLCGSHPSPSSSFIHLLSRGRNEGSLRLIPRTKGQFSPLLSSPLSKPSNKRQIERLIAKISKLNSFMWHFSYNFLRARVVVVICSITTPRKKFKSHIENNVTFLLTELLRTYYIFFELIFCSCTFMHTINHSQNV
jgi:hypothetical protein